MSRSPIITDGLWSSDPTDWLRNPHAGEILNSEFMRPLTLETADLGERIGVPASRLEDAITGRARMNGELDLRLARYFNMSEGFFLRLQDHYELIEAKRALNGALDRIVPRAA